MHLHKTDPVFHDKNIILTVKHSGGSVTVWGCFAVIDGNMNSALYQKNSEGECVTISSCPEPQEHTWVIQKDNDQEQTTKSTSQWLKNKMKALAWSSQSLDLNQIDMLWHDLKPQTAYRVKCSNVAELKQFCAEEWAKTSL